MATEEKVEAPVEVKPAEVKPVVIDERKMRLMSACEVAIEASARAEADIAASKSLKTYAAAGLKHAETIRCEKAFVDYDCEKRGVATEWTPACYEKAIDKITRWSLVLSPELFGDFEALKEKSAPPSKNRERVHTRILVGLVSAALEAVLGEAVWLLPYGLVANYLIAEKLFKFSKADLGGSLVEANVEFLKTNLGLLASKATNTSSFLNALQTHFGEIKKAAEEAANAHLTPAERKLRVDAAAEGVKAVEAEKKTTAVREGFVKYLGQALAGNIAPDEVATMIASAAKSAKVSLPFGKLKPEELTVDDLDKFLESVVKRGGATQEIRRDLIKTIVKHGSRLEEQRKNKAARKLQLAATA